MKPRSYLGCAGTGKTTQLLTDVRKVLEEGLLREGQRLLAITRMNGARRRLESKLKSGSRLFPYDCRTIDSLAWMIASRWRTRAAQLQLPQPTELDFDGTCGLAARLMEEEDVGTWLAAAYPIVMVDECQDCRDARLLLVERIAAATRLFVAADDFQNLDGLDSPAVAWINKSTDKTELTVVHRTTQTALLSAASRIRALQSLTPSWDGRNGFSLAGAKNPMAAAKWLVQAIHWSKGAEVVVLTPTGPTASPFVAQVLARAAAEPVFLDKHGNPMKAYTVSWETGGDQAVELLVAAVKDGTHRTSHLTGASELGQWFDRARRLRGKVSFGDDEIRAAATRAVQHHRAHSRPSRRLRGMTIHQAKNQEFDHVVVLWPVQVAGKGEKLSRLLYNAVTRAKTSALVIVQDLKDRIGKPPFRMSDTVSGDGC